MVKVFVLGVTGFIGNPVAKAFARAGHEVYGLTRNTAKVTELARDEIIGVIGDVRKPETWTQIASQASVIVDASVDYQDGPAYSTSIVDNVTKIAKQTGRKITFIFTSGIWLYGHRPHEITEESDIFDVPETLGWRASLEKVVAHSADFKGVVLRPACVYGKSGSLFGSWFSQATHGKVNIFGNENTRWAVVHADDLAEAYVAAAENIAHTRGEIIAISNTNTESVTEIVRAALRVLSHPHGTITYSAPSNWFETALSFSSRPSNRKSITLLGFQQRHSGVVDGIDVYVKSWKAYQ
ncbi:hypothetical protein BC936DRAFT_143984 [Jimgerdemannia flammicorona]|uniref:Uncharacterized protein n=2 Tax=Jimgerdemannia flammicorona TaxID=994334 RepID=A0A433QAV5_9FUNG|nr:hypothetical protein BC936DRAFT_143984 [Jimgerdemannia flammicorona]RUS26917.1 hypothetical protein BC938DRAFT_483937 [Jimgerdemannia flammicorona]